jgi:hypothetical protein
VAQRGELPVVGVYAHSPDKMQALGVGEPNAASWQPMTSTRHAGDLMILSQDDRGGHDVTSLQKSKRLQASMGVIPGSPFVIARW